ncbi:DNA polymerase III subunit gamma/tau [Legionella hackeliae]|uniref:DNA polymerase III subunit gamma/tau n=1 Tax=Legionella hackeliae TaxID=449 RepID=A0A0A8UR70_LEGHA|nr:DNA polymerase III subunit gamma/tau [Legionella hackeliae]KTD14807.1 DNA polymerase III subunits gamma and tau [Legionella hackeliae]CEK09567.1 DNA polymerase III subunits gamma and tau [Legionella hackeliae]STX49477.1 DNA polymerase III, gamma and tau subunits [Legionella hackeliae]
MSYLALARKWRPRTFSQLVGQEHINKALINSLNQQRLHHAYLFTGTRGVGKTSVARLLAKALNCGQGVSAEPCLQCEACVAIEQGRFLDLIEIDGASRTRVEDTRELLENVQYAPTNGRFKIYLIDEVHMLSQHSFNALLKTLEEPPAHVKFLLATTDPQKLPITVLSRCLQFHLKHLATELISQHLLHILSEEQLNFELDALDILAKAARGSMRDALSLLDQAIASCNGNLIASEVKTILGYTQQDYAIQLVEALASSNPQSILQISRQVAAEGGHFRYVLDEFLHYMHDLTIYQNIGDNPLIEINSHIKKLAAQISAEDIQLFYQIGLKGSEEMYLAPSLAIGFEMTMLRMLTFRPAPKTMPPTLAFEVPATTIQTTTLVEHSPQQELPRQELPIVNSENIAFEEKEEVEEFPHEITDDENLEVEFSPPSVVENTTIQENVIVEDNWAQILNRLQLTGLALNAVENAEFVGKNGHEINLRVAKGHQSLFTPTITSRIEQALANYYKETIKIALTCEEVIHSSPAQQRQVVQHQRQQEAALSLEEDVFFQQLKQEFSAELVKNSIEPIKDEL